MSSVKDNEANKFTIGKSGKPAVKVSYDGLTPMPVETSGVEWDEITTTFPQNTQDLFTYKLNSVTVQTILVTYADSSKKTIVQVQKTRL